jgi:hypothetical protein
VIWNIGLRLIDADACAMAVVCVQAFEAALTGNGRLAHHGTGILKCVLCHPCPHMDTLGIPNSDGTREKLFHQDRFALAAIPCNIAQ